MLEIEDLYVEIEAAPLLKGFSLRIEPGEIHALMGPNGAGKSTLAKVLSGHPSYEVKKGKILFMGQDLLSLAPEERSHFGLFIGFQYPVEIPGVSNSHFLHSALNAQRKSRKEIPLLEEEFKVLLQQKMEELGIKQELSTRDVNSGLSGGEKKRNELLQMGLFFWKLAILDEIDSGLDISAMRQVARNIKKEMDRERGKSLLLITHYQRLLDYIEPDFVHVVLEGRIVLSGKADLAKTLEEKGYEWLTAEKGERL